MNKITLLTPEELEHIVMAALKKHETELHNKESEHTFFTINKVAKLLKRSHTTIKKLVESGIIESTQDGMISQKHLDDYLKNNS